MKRCPAVVFDAVIPSTSSGTTSAPPSSLSRQRIECSGRTQRKEPLPQRIDFGQGKLRMVLSTTSATIAAAGRPGFSTTAKKTWPFFSSRSSSWSRVRPVERRKPSSAASGASARGPLRSSRTGRLWALNPSSVSTRRRGVEKVPALA